MSIMITLFYNILRILMFYPSDDYDDIIWKYFFSYYNILFKYFFKQKNRKDHQYCKIYIYDYASLILNMFWKYVK